MVAAQLGEALVQRMDDPVQVGRRRLKRSPWPDLRPGRPVEGVTGLLVHERSRQEGAPTVAGTRVLTDGDAVSGSAEVILAG